MNTTRAKILDGKSLSAKIRKELKVRAQKLRDEGIVPRLDVFVSAEDPASQAYVRMKRRFGSEIGVVGEQYEIASETSGSWVLDKIAELNEDPEVHGILVQHPLPKTFDENEILYALGPKKDVDGISPQSLGLLLTGGKGFRCATPLGMMRLLDEYGLACEGLQAVVIGRSVILGKPAALMLLERNATVTICHSKTKNLDDICRRADLLVAAVGKAEMIKGDWIKPGAIVLDAGYNKVAGRSGEVGDVEFEKASQVAGWITPVPGGIGPMTVAMLLSNTLDAAEMQTGRCK